MTHPANAVLAPGRAAGGFTLVELVALIALVGIVAAVAAPRFFTASTFSSRGFADQTAAFLRYAQKAAIARHTLVHVQQTGNSLGLCLGTTTPCPSGQRLAGPDGSAHYQVSAPAGIGLGLTGGNFSFDAQGRPSGGRVLTISGDGILTLTVEAETGYVH